MGRDAEDARDVRWDEAAPQRTLLAGELAVGGASTDERAHILVEEMVAKELAVVEPDLM